MEAIIVHLDCNFSSPQCTEPHLLDEYVSDELSWRKRFGKYTSIKVYTLSSMHGWDRPKHAERLQFAKDIIDAAPSLKGVSFWFPALNHAADQEEEKHHGAPPRKRDRKQMSKVASSHRGG